jgi:nitrogen regulatory protein PII
MKQLTVVVKPFRTEAVLSVIAELGVDSCVVREAKGYSRQKGYLDRYLGSEYSMAFIPKVEITLWISDALAEEALPRLARAARTGRMGDGKIFVVEVMGTEAIEF